MDRYPHTAAGSLFAACDIRVVAEERRAGEVDTLDPVPEEQGLIVCAHGLKVCINGCGRSLRSVIDEVHLLNSARATVGRIPSVVFVLPRTVPY